MKHDDKIYLGKRGTAFGPFGTEQIEAMRLSGEIDAYSFIWDAKGRKWVTLDTPPPDLGTERAPASFPSDLGKEAVCLASDGLLGGTLENLSDLGCDLVSEDESETPALMVNAVVVLNVMDASGSKAKNLKASLARVTRRAGKWIYGFRWAGRPSF